MIDPDDVVKYDRTDFELQEFLMFCVLVAGKSARTTAKNLDKLLSAIGVEENNPLDKIYQLKVSGYNLPELMKKMGFGCYNIKANALIDLSKAIFEKRLDIRYCSVNELESMKGIGPKTARYFVLYSRQDVKDIAVLDTHILKHMQELGYDVPASTPTGKKYKELEKQFVEHVAKTGMTMQEYDLATWKERRK